MLFAKPIPHHQTIRNGTKRDVVQLSAHVLSSAAAATGGVDWALVSRDNAICIAIINIRPTYNSFYRAMHCVHSAVLPSSVIRPSVHM